DVEGINFVARVVCRIITLKRGCLDQLSQILAGMTGGDKIAHIATPRQFRKTYDPDADGMPTACIRLPLGASLAGIIIIGDDYNLAPLHVELGPGRNIAGTAEGECVEPKAGEGINVALAFAPEQQANGVPLRERRLAGRRVGNALEPFRGQVLPELAMLISDAPVLGELAF